MIPLVTLAGFRTLWPRKLLNISARRHRTAQGYAYLSVDDALALTDALATLMLLWLETTILARKWTSECWVG
jgi:hypothetical protein